MFDNAAVIGEDPRIREATAENFHAVLTERYWYVNHTAGLYRPLTTSSYLLNYAVLGNGTRPAGYHAVNLALHEANAALVYALGVSIFGGAGPAFALAAVWGLHPLLTDAVTNIVGRADLLAALGALAGLLCYIRFARSGGGRKAGWLIALTVSQAVALFSKETGAVLPGLLLLYDLLWARRETWRTRVPAYASLILPFALFFYLRGGLVSHMVIDVTENPLVGTDFWTARMTALKVVGQYLALFVCPAALSADYSYNSVPLFGWSASTWEDLQALLVLACCAAGTAGAVWAWKRGDGPRMLLFGTGYFVVTLSVVSNLVMLIGTIKAERFLYLPSVGLAACAIIAVRAMQRWWKQPSGGWAILGCICLVLAGRTYARNLDWRDDLSFWSSAASVSSQSSRAHYNLARELERIPGRLTDAIAEYEIALRIEPGHADAHNNLGNCLARAGRMAEAMMEYRSALRIRPNHADAHNNLGNALAANPDQLPEAMAEFEAAIAATPEHPKAHGNLADALAEIPGRLPDAIAEYQMALRLTPGRPDVWNGMANALARIPGRVPEAIAAYREALRLQPVHAEGHFNLANALARTPGRLPDAIAEYQEALRLEPDLTAAHVNLGNALAQVPGRMREAVAQYQAALRSDPKEPVALVNLANAQGRLQSRGAADK